MFSGYSSPVLPWGYSWSWNGHRLGSSRVLHIGAALAKWLKPKRVWPGVLCVAGTLVGWLELYQIRFRWLLAPCVMASVAGQLGLKQAQTKGSWGVPYQGCSGGMAGAQAGAGQRVLCRECPVGTAGTKIGVSQGCPDVCCTPLMGHQELVQAQVGCLPWGEELELVWSKDLGLAEVSRQLKCADFALICTIKGKGEYKLRNSSAL